MSDDDDILSLDSRRPPFNVMPDVGTKLDLTSAARPVDTWSVTFNGKSVHAPCTRSGCNPGEGHTINCQRREAGFPQAPTLRVFDTGSRRDADADAERYDLVSHHGMRRLAATYAEGAAKYDDHNWRKGQPYSVVMNHAVRHCYLWLAGHRDEDHLAHAAWGLFALMEFEATHPEMNDLYQGDK